MRKNINYFLYFFLIVTTITAQKKLNYNSKGELNLTDYKLLLKNKKYQAISAFDTVSTKPLLVYAIYIKNKKLGILDHTAKEVTPAIYDGIEGLNISYTTVMFGFHQSYPVKIGKKYGLISNRGKVILPLEYDYINCEAKKSVNRTQRKEVVTDSVIFASKGNEEMYFSPKGKLLKKVNNNQQGESEVVQETRYYDDNFSNYSTPEKKYETSPYGTIIQKLDNGFAIIQAKVENKYYYQGLIDLATNKLILPAIYSNLMVVQKDKIIAIKDKKYNLFNTKGELLLQETYDRIDSFNKIYWIKKEGKTAIFDLDLNQKSDFIYDSFGSSGPDFMEAKIGTKEGVIDTYGNITIPFIYDDVEGYFNRLGSGFAFFKVTKDGKKGILSTKGEKLTEIVYDEITPECTIEEHDGYGELTMPIDHDYNQKENNYFIIKKEDKYGLLDNSFKPMIENKYDIIKKSFHNDFVIIGKKQANNYPDLSLLNIRTNTIILPYEYDYFKYLGGNYFMIYKKAQMAVCNFDGKIIIPMAPCTDLSDRFYHSTIYHGLSKIDGRKSNYLIDYQGTQVDMASH